MIKFAAILALCALTITSCVSNKKESMQLTSNHFIQLVKNNSDLIKSSRLPEDIEIKNISIEKKTFTLTANGNHVCDASFGVNNEEKKTYYCVLKWKLWDVGTLYIESIIDINGKAIRKSIDVTNLLPASKVAEEKEDIQNCSIRTEFIHDDGESFLAYEFYPFHQDDEPLYILITNNSIIDYPIDPYKLKYFELRSKEN